MKSIDYRNSDHFLRDSFFMPDRHEMPFVYNQNIDVRNLALSGFDKTRVKEESSERRDRTVHFFLDDYKFDEVWNDPDSQVKKLAQYKQVMAPDFSVYSNMPYALQVYNVFRSRWCAAFWQRNKLTVIPTITWADDRSFDFCFEGVEKGATVAISTIGNLDNINEFMTGYSKMIDQIKPEGIINYGKLIDGMDNFADIVNIPYARPEDET
jgi:hypothetical protein